MKEIYAIRYKDREGKGFLNLCFFETKEKAEQYVKENLPRLPENTWNDIKIVSFTLK